MMFEQIIFPTTVKPVPKNNYEFDFWIVGLGDNKELMVKCPTCFFTYPLQNVANEVLMKNNLREYEPYYFNTVVRNCPRKAYHVL